MKDNKQNIADLIGALAEDIEEIKKSLGAKNATDKDDTLQGLAVRLEPVIRFFSGDTPKNISEIFGSRESIANYKKSLGDEMIVSMQVYTDDTEKNMRDHGILSIREMLDKILEMQAVLVKNHRLSPEATKQKRGFWHAIRPGRVINAVRKIWSKVPYGWYKNPYAWAGIGCALVFFAMFAVSWLQWREYREENRRLRAIEDKHRVTTVMLNELYPELAVTVGAYEELLNVVGVDSTLAIFNRQVKMVRESEGQAGQR